MKGEGRRGEGTNLSWSLKVKSSLGREDGSDGQDPPSRWVGDVVVVSTTDLISGFRV